MASNHWQRVCTLAVVTLLVLHCTPVQADAPPNAVPFTTFDSFVGTWQGKCTQTGYVNPDMPNDLTCGISLNELFSYDFSVTFGAGKQYSFQTGIFSQIGQNVSFTSSRVNQTIYPLSGSGAATLTDIANGGSKCMSVTWSQGGTTSSFLGTIVRSVPGSYGVYLEEGRRQFTQSAVTGSTLDCPSDTNQPHYCDPGTNVYSYTCYAIISNLPATLA